MLAGRVFSELVKDKVLKSGHYIKTVHVMQKGAECTHIKWSTAFVDRLWVDGWGGGGGVGNFVCALCLDLRADLHHLRPAFLAGRLIRMRCHLACMHHFSTP